MKVIIGLLFYVTLVLYVVTVGGRKVTKKCEPLEFPNTTRDCDQDPNIRNGRYNDGTICTFDCVEGCVKDKGSRRRECKVKGRTKWWRGGQGLKCLCNPCDSPPSHPEGSTSDCGPDQAPYPAGHVCIFTCSAGYSQASGGGRKLCVNGKWRGGDIVCIAQSTPAQSTRAQTPAQSTPAQTPAQSTPAQTPAQSTPAQTPAQSTRAQTPAQSTPAQTPAQSTPAQTPAQSTPAQTPAQSTPAQTPAQSTPAQTPAQSTPAQTPAQSTRAQTPAQSTPAQTPAQSTPAQTPAQSTPAQTPVQMTPTQPPAQSIPAQTPVQSTPVQTPAPSQTPETDCGPPPAPSNTTRSGCDAPYTHGAVCNYQYEPGFIQVNGSNVRTCENGMWTGTDLVCLPLIVIDVYLTFTVVYMPEAFQSKLVLTKKTKEEYDPPVLNVD
ncbi:uncharacterized protein LOC144878285 [Branchiostoma floridae x Branchiostoma japonicum]